jgi:hypothetical protein
VTPASTNGNSVVPKEAPPAEAVAEQAHAVDAIDLPSPHRVSGVTLAALATAAGVAAIVLGTWAFVSSVRDEGSGSVQVVRTAPVYGAAQAISLLSKPSTQRLPLRGSQRTVTLAVGAGGRGVLVLDGLAIAPLGLTYQAWVLDPAKRPLEHIPAAIFTGVETIVPLSARVPPGWFLGVSAEKSGGVEKPTHAFRFGAQRPG